MRAALAQASSRHSQHPRPGFFGPGTACPASATNRSKSACGLAFLHPTHRRWGTAGRTLAARLPRVMS
jgi:hypothetical protein